MFPLLNLLWILFFPRPKEATLIRYPYLQQVQSDAATILWSSTSKAIPAVAWSEIGSKNWQVTVGQNISRYGKTKVHKVKLTGLSSNTRYQYKLLHGKKYWLEGQLFNFSSWKAPDAEPVTFFAVGDIGEPVAESGKPDQLGISIAEKKDSLDFGLLLGDIIYPDGKLELYDQNLFPYFTQVFPYLSVWPVPGNHDWASDPTQNYLKVWDMPHNGHYYHFSSGNGFFIGLDSGNGDFFEYEVQKQWLVQTLSNVNREQYPWIIVFLHHNGKSCTYKKDNEAVIELYPIFSHYKVNLVLNGHAHTYERLNPMDGSGEVSEEGFTAITVGSGGKLRGVGTDPTPFVPDPDNCQHPTLVARSVHDWVWLKLDMERNQLRGTAISVSNNQIVDHFELRKH